MRRPFCQKSVARLALPAWALFREFTVFEPVLSLKP
jgi:hypothetical protein